MNALRNALAYATNIKTEKRNRSLHFDFSLEILFKLGMLVSIYFCIIKNPFGLRYSFAFDAKKYNCLLILWMMNVLTNYATL